MASPSGLCVWIANSFTETVSYFGFKSKAAIDTPSPPFKLFLGNRSGNVHSLRRDQSPPVFRIEAKEARLKRYLSYGLLLALLAALYLLVAGSLDRQELAAACATAVGALLLLLRLRKIYRRNLAFRIVWLGPLWRIIPALFQETWQLYGALFRCLAGRREEGIFLEHLFRSDPRDPHGPLRLAWMAFGVCVTPNSYLVRVDHDRGTATVRQLVGTRLSAVDIRFLELP